MRAKSLQTHGTSQNRCGRATTLHATCRMVAASNWNGANLKALVVDDSRATRMILKNVLKQEGFEVFEAGDGRQALEELAKIGAADLALVDWNMPVMTGYELICEVRARREFDRMAIMMVTTESESSQVQRALDAGANEYVMKPFTADILREKLLMLGLGKE